MNIKYSIIIPTRNGAKYLPFAIQSVLNSSRNDIELIVSNNFSVDATEEILSQIADPRLKIISPSVFLPLAGHYEFALSKATGEWITILGDDDAVMPYIFESMDKYIAQYPQIDIISSARAYFFWEGSEDLHGNTVIGYSSTSKSALRSSEKDLDSVLKGTRSCFNMPQIYTTCIVKRTLYEEIKARSGGCFYHSIVADMYSIVALCLARDQYLRVEEPLFWVGTSNKSLGLSDRVYRDAEQFAGDPAGTHVCVPRAISGDVSYFLHISKFSAMFVYECVLQSPLSRASHKQNKLRANVLAAILNDSRKREAFEKKQLLEEIQLECNRYGISKNRVYRLALLFRGYIKLQKLLVLPSYALRRIGVFPRPIRLSSTDRQKFPTILDASAAVSDLKASEKPYE